MTGRSGPGAPDGYRCISLDQCEAGNIRFLSYSGVRYGHWHEPLPPEAADMTNTIDRKSARAKRKARERRRTPEAQADPDRHRPGADHADRRAGFPGQAQPARSAQPRPEVRRQAGVLRRRRHQPPVQAGIRGSARAPTRLRAGGRKGADYFDLTPDDDQKMIVETVNEFAEEVLRPAAREADETASYPTGSRHEGQRTGHHRDQHPRRFRRVRRTPRRRDERVGRRGSCVRRHGIGAADPRTRRCRIGAHPLGQRRPTGHLSQGVRRRERAPGVRGDRRTAARCSTRLR